MRSPRLALITLKRLFSDSALVRAAVIAVTLVPLLYGALYLWAFWDPYGKLDKMPVALVNEDVAATVDSETIDAGHDLVVELLDKHTVDWHVVSAQEASAGLAARRYYLALTIPRDFSAKLATANTAHPVRARLHVTAQESSNMLAAQIASRVFGEIRAAAGESAAKGYFDNAYKNFGEARNGFSDAADGAGTLAKGLVTARDGARSLASGSSTAKAGAVTLAAGLGALDAGAGSAYSGATQLAAGSPSLVAGLAHADRGAYSLAGGAKKLAAGAAFADAGAHDVAAGTSSLASGLSAADSGAAKVARGANRLESGSGQLAGALGTLDAGARQLSSASEDLESGATQLQQSIDDALGQVGDAASSAGQVKDGAVVVDSALRAYVAAHPEAADDPDFATALGASSHVKTGAEQLADGLDRAAAHGPALASGATDLATGAKQLHAGLQQLAAGLGSADGGAHDLASGASDLAGGTASLSAGVGSAASGAAALAAGSARLTGGTSVLASGASEVASGSAALARGVRVAHNGAGALAIGTSKLTAGTQALAVGTRSARGGAAALASGLRVLDTGAHDLATGLAPAVSGSHELASGLTAGATAIPAYSSATKTANATMMSDAVALDTVRVGEVPTYGTGFTPYFVPLALWIGALLIFFIIRPLPARALAAGTPAPITALAGFLPAAAIAGVQSLVLLAVVQFALGLHPVDPLAYYGFGLLAAVTFVAVLQMFNAALGTVGKLVSIVVLMLQLTSAGGTFPIQMVPGFFQAISPYLPMTHVVVGLRQAISGGDLHTLASEALLLLGVAVVSLAITTAAAYRAQTYTMERLHPSLEL